MNEQLQADKLGSDALVKRMPGVSERTVYLWLSASTAPLPRSRAALEEALGWKRGSVTSVLEAPITQEPTLSEVRDWGHMEEAPEVVREVPAASASTHELLMEVIRRLGAMSAENEQLRAEVKAARRVDGASPAKTQQDMFGLAAHSTDAGMNSEHLEDGV